MLDFASFGAITFDCYGTLIDWESGLLGALQPYLRSMGLSLPDEELLGLYARLEAEAEHGPFQIYKDVLRRVMRSLAAHLGFAFGHPRDEDLLVRAIADWRPFPDTVAALSVLGRGRSLCILSNIDEDLIAHSRRWLQVPFAAVVTAEQLRSYKPAPAHFLAAPERLGLPKERILHVAQSLYHDIAPARALGFATVWVNRRRGRAGTGATPASAATPDLEVGSLAELAQLMGG